MSKKEILESWSSVARDGLMQLRNLNDTERAILNAMEILNGKIQELVDEIKGQSGYHDIEVVKIKNTNEKKEMKYFICKDCEGSFPENQMHKKSGDIICGDCLRHRKAM